MKLSDTFYRRDDEPWPDWMTPMPGERLRANDEAEMYLKFVKEFRRHEPGGIPTYVPSTATFHRARLVDQSILDASDLDDDTSVYWMAEFPVRITACDMKSVRSYFAERQDDEEFDTYIFPKGLHWCIALTHDNIWLSVGSRELRCGQAFYRTISKLLAECTPEYARRLIILLAHGGLNLIRKDMSQIEQAEGIVLNIDVYLYCKDILKDDQLTGAISHAMELSTVRDHVKDLSSIATSCNQIEDVLGAAWLAQKQL